MVSTFCSFSPDMCCRTCRKICQHYLKPTFLHLLQNASSVVWYIINACCCNYSVWWQCWCTARHVCIHSRLPQLRVENTRQEQNYRQSLKAAPRVTKACFSPGRTGLLWTSLGGALLMCLSALGSTYLSKPPCMQPHICQAFTVISRDVVDVDVSQHVCQVWLSLYLLLATVFVMHIQFAVYGRSLRYIQRNNCSTWSVT